MSRKEIEDDWTWLQDTMMTTLGETRFSLSSPDDFNVLMCCLG